jgi:hypothetical protein
LGNRISTFNGKRRLCFFSVSFNLVFNALFFCCFVFGSFLGVSVCLLLSSCFFLNFKISRFIFFYFFSRRFFFGLCNSLLNSALFYRSL